MLQQQVNRVERDLAKALERITILEAENTALYHQLDTYGIGNPELSGSAKTLPKRVETIDHPSHEDEEIVHSPRKLGGESALLEPTPAALGDIEWRCKNLPKRGTLNSDPKPEQANPVARREGIPSQTSVETVQEARLEDDEETVHS